MVRQKFTSYIEKMAKIIRTPTRRQKLGWIALIIILYVINWLIFVSLVNKPHIFIFTASIPVILASILFKVKGGLLSGLMTGIFLLFPFTSFFWLKENIILFNSIYGWSL